MGSLIYSLLKNNSSRNLKTYFYDWQPQTPISSIDKSLLSEKCRGVIFLKFGSFDIQEDEISFFRELNRKTLDSYNGLKINVCYRMEDGFIKNFKDRDPQLAAIFIASKITNDFKDAISSGAQLTGVQLDFDCPRSGLGWYQKFLRKLKANLPVEALKSFSITVLPDWMFSPIKFKLLLNQVDYYTPLFFGFGISHRVEELRSIGSLTSMRWYLWLAHLYGKKYLVGLPTYSIALVYDSKGGLMSVESDLSPQDLFKCKDLRQIQGGLDSPWGGTRMEFNVLHPCLVDGREFKPGIRIITQSVDAQLLRALSSEVMKTATSLCEGFLFFRLEKNEGEGGITPCGVLQATGIDPIDQKIDTAILDMEVKKGIATFRVSLWNDSEFTSRSLKLPAFVQLRWLGGELLEFNPGDFESYFWCHGFERKIFPASMARANCLRLMARIMPPHSRFTTGLIQVKVLNPDFALYLYSDVPVSTDETRHLNHDFEAYPQPITPTQSVEDIGL